MYPIPLLFLSNIVSWIKYGFLPCLKDSRIPGIECTPFVVKIQRELIPEMSRNQRKSQKGCLESRFRCKRIWKASKKKKWKMARPCCTAQYIFSTLFQGNMQVVQSSIFFSCRFLGRLLLYLRRESRRTVSTLHDFSTLFSSFSLFSFFFFHPIGCVQARLPRSHAFATSLDTQPALLCAYVCFRYACACDGPCFQHSVRVARVN